jgi:hypothetical protein
MANLVGTQSLLLASWYLYSDHVRFIEYRDGKFWFDDPERLTQFLVGGYHGHDPKANIHKFEKCRNLLISARRASQIGGVR